MSADHHRYPSGFGVQVEVMDGVNEVEESAGQLDGFGFGELGAVAVGVDVAADGGDRGELAQGTENARVADISGVEDVVDSAQRGERFGAQQAVGVGDDA